MISGVFTYKNGASYNGEVENERVSGAWQKFGKGIYIYPDGQIYEGEWYKDMRHGHGTLKDKVGVVLYSGEWVNDARKTGGFFTKLKDKLKG